VVASHLTETEALPRLDFAVASAEAVQYAAAPTLAFELAIGSDRPIRSLSLNVQLRIVPTRRGYDEDEKTRLAELFGTPDRWGETLRGFLWTNATLVVPSFTGSTRAQLTVPCTYDLEIAAAKYFHALANGDVPVELLFSGTAFYLADGGLLRTAQISWESEAQFALPVRVWKEAIENHFPGAAWIRLRRDVYDRLLAYKAGRTLPTWEAALEELLDRKDG
jgi:Family of unknown function (DUF6084)